MHLRACADEPIGRRRGGTGSTAVTAPAGCAWTGVSNNTSWLTVTSGASGSGTGTVAFSASANPTTSARTGTLTIGGQTFNVKQAAASCTYALLADEPVGRRRWRHGVDGGDGAGRVCVDGRQQQHVVVDGDERRERQRQRHRGVQCVGQSEHERAHGHDHDRGPDVQRDAGGRGRAPTRCCRRASRSSPAAARVDGGDGAGRVCVDGREQQHVVVDGDERRERQRDRHRGVQCVGQSEHERAHGTSRSGARRSA